MTKMRSIQRRQQRHRAPQVHDATRRVRMAIAEALLQATLTGGADRGPLRVPPAAIATAPARMSMEQTDDPATAEALRATYERCLKQYRDLARAHGAARDVDDVGRAVAFFVGASLHALHGVDATSGVLEPLERQLRAIARARANWDQATAEERQSFFERIAILAVWVSGSYATASSQGPQAVDHVRRSARQYLEQFLGVDPDWLTLGPSGLAAREGDRPATPVAEAA